jgi:hypothetical protein
MIAPPFEGMSVALLAVWQASNKDPRVKTIFEKHKTIA